jgi:orotate phosphoribosyltransferase-like protein
MMAAKIREIIKKHPEIEALASCGHSGLMMMGALSYVTGLPQIAVRKPHPSDHDKKLVNGWLGCKGFLIIDDFVSSGQTIMKITKDIQKSATAEINAERTSKGLKEIDIPVEDLPQPIACLLYNEDWNSEHTVYDLDGKCLEIPSYSALSEDLEVKF